MEKVLKRGDIDINDTWDLTDIYKDNKEFNNDLESVLNSFKEFSLLKDRFLEDSNSFLNYFKKNEELLRTIIKLDIYASLYSDTDKNNTNGQEMLSRIQNIVTEYLNITSSVVPDMLDFGKENILKYIDNDPYLNDYKYYIDSIFREKDHSLSKEEERIISSYSNVFSNSSETASYILNTDLKFKDVIDSNNNSYPLNESFYSNYIKSLDRKLREDSFNKLYEGYKNSLNSLTSTYNGVLLNDSVTKDLRGYNNSLEMYLYPHKIPNKLYLNLIDTVSNNLGSLYEYYDLKKKLLKLDSYHLYDSYVSILDIPSKKYSFNDAKEICLKALSVMGKEYTNTLKKEFNNRWIDVYPSIGKRSGGYQTGSYDTHPYILLNFTGTLNDVSTLAHESGHAMHTYYSNKYNSYANSDYPIFLAEIASTTNELLLSDYLYKNSNNIDEKRYILNERLDLFKATIYRQTMFAEFELYSHNLADNKEPITGERLCNKYLKLNKKYFGPNVVVDDNIKYEWERIPHFYTPFYVYQYATSLCIANYIAKNIINKTEGFLNKYILFLKSGGRNYPLDVLKIIDIDLNDSKVFVEALNSFKDTLDEFKKLY